MADPTTGDLVRLMTWLSPSYPVGAFSYSHGLEWAVEAGDIATAADLGDWLSVLLEYGSGWTDAVIFAHVWRAADSRDDGALADIAELSAALQPSAERLLEAAGQGRAFIAATRAAWPCAVLETGVFADKPAGPLSPKTGSHHSSSGRRIPPITYPVAVAATAAGHGVPLQLALPAYLHAFAANLVSAGVRLVPLGQTDGQAVTAALAPSIEDIAIRAIAAPLDDLGGAAFRSDIASMKHETQYTRLFRS